MTAGSNVKVNIWRMTNASDDYVGGASITGTVSYQNVPARFQAEPEEMVLLQQGIETLRIFTMVIGRKHLDISERDEIQVVHPPSNPYYEKRFRIISIRHSDMDDPRGYMMFRLTRSVRSRAEQ